jgi:alkanesulfonate monooxygenase SsuD/methylene tetrahydromethanopterin reductase-like flavin-dependent oxidoreductase (luciferase family)
MSAITLDHLSGGRFILGLGASGPQVVEGWYGRPYPRPLERTREYVEIVRDIIGATGPVEFHGKHYDMPYTGSRPGSASRSSRPCARCATTSRSTSVPRGRRTWPWRPRSATAGSRCSSPPKDDAFYRARLAEGFAAGPVPVEGRALRGGVVVTIIPGDDVEAVRRPHAPLLALYAGGMGAKDANFHFDVFARMGYEEECDQDPGALPGRAASRRRRRDPHRDGRGRRLIGPDRQDPRRPRPLEGDLPHHGPAERPGRPTRHARRPDQRLTRSVSGPARCRCRLRCRRRRPGPTTSGRGRR